MKKITYYLSSFFVLALFLLSACQEEVVQNEEEAEENIDEISEVYAGSYICKVTKEVFRDSIIDSYVDTIEITRIGEENLTIGRVRNFQLPEVKFMNGNVSEAAYSGLLTIVAFRNDSTVKISHGFDSAFYRFNGTKVFLD